MRGTNSPGANLNVLQRTARSAKPSKGWVL